MRFSDDLIEEIRVKNDIVDVIGGYVNLKKKGSSYFGLCPFHNEKTPSFSVSPGKQMYYCFGCGAGGNVITFIMEYENYNFIEAIGLLADRAGMELPKMEYSREAQEQARKKEELLLINKEAAKYYYFGLKSERGAAARDYLSGRGISKEMIRHFGLGFSDRFGAGLYTYLKNKGYGDEVLHASGLFNVDEKNGMYDKFWNRVIFPIMDVNNKVIGFGGRVMGEGKPKYLNSPETQIFDKSRNLYGLHVARTSRKKNLIICEGYMDVISMHQAGFTNAVASLGTALTALQAGLLKRYTDEVLVIYDSDGAGIKAALRAIPILSGVGLHTKVVNLNPCKDPDEFIKKMGAEAFDERLEAAENSFLYTVRMMEADYDLKDPQGKTDFMNQTAAKLLSFTDELERGNYIDAVAAKYYVNREDLAKLVNRVALKGMGRTETPKPRSGLAKKPKKADGREQSQRLMLTWITSYPELLSEISRYITPEDFTTDLYRQVAGMIYEQGKAGRINPAQVLNAFIDSENQKAAAALFNASIPLSSEREKHQALIDVICTMKENSIEYKSTHLAPTDLAGLRALIESKKELENWKRGGLHISMNNGGFYGN